MGVYFQLIVTLYIVNFIKIFGLSDNQPLHQLQTCQIMNPDQMKMFVPHTIPRVPERLMTVFFKNLHLPLGNKLTPTQVKFEPRVHWPTEPDALYIVTMVDPDFMNPWHPELGEVIHWLVINIPGAANEEEEKMNVQVTRGDDIVDYVGAFPSKDSGLHRYLLLAFKQPEKIYIGEPWHSRISSTNRDDRLHFKIEEFTRMYNLTGPVAGNFFVAEYDDWVLEINKKFDEEAMRDL